MLFTTIMFLLFFVVVYLVFWSLPNSKRLVWILVVSIVFYAAWSLAFAIHFCFMVALNYLFLVLMDKANAPSVKKTWMRVAVLINLTNLFFFKYFYLFLKILHDLSPLQIFEENYFNAWLNSSFGYDYIILPLAISFYSFQLIAYIVDVYRGTIQEKPDALRFFVFILFFPQLIAGPIMRHSDFMSQLIDVKADEQKTQLGMYLVLIGLVKKVIIADNVIAAIYPVFDSPQSYDSLSNIAAILGFSAQVYCDFSGYTDMARGLALLLGLELPRNFIGPYLATSCRNLWTRWHITLSTWLRDYIYIPLGGSRRGEVMTYFNLIVTFTLGGLWHGANYTYIMWGFLHGVALSIERLLGVYFPGDWVQKIQGATESRKYIKSFLNLSGIIYTFTIFQIGVVFFRSKEISDAWVMLAQVGGRTSGNEITSVHNNMLFALMAVTFFFNWLQSRQKWIFKLSNRWRYLTILAMSMITLILLGRYSPSGAEYIYFQF